MKGKPGTLSVSAGEKGLVLSEYWTISGAQGNKWFSVSVDIPLFLDPVVSSLFKAFRCM